jgi:predicted DNA-binding transcriptional regulator AlpA
MKTYTKDEAVIIEPLMSKIEAAEFVAAYLHVSFKQVYDRYMHMPDFPKAVPLPSPTGKKSRKRWNKSDLYAWMTGNKIAA